MSTPLTSSLFEYGFKGVVKSTRQPARAELSEDADQFCAVTRKLSSRPPGRLKDAALGVQAVSTERPRDDDEGFKAQGWKC